MIPGSTPPTLHPTTPPVLRVENLRVTFPTAQGDARAVDGISFDVHDGETVCVVGESGCGKSVTALSLLHLVPSPGVIAADSRITLVGHDVLRLPDRELRALRGRVVSMVFQEPMTALNPVLTVGEQVAEVVRVHTGANTADAWQQAVTMLQDVGIADAAMRARQYPHELSGGMRQRVMIAMALILHPRVVIADEPTTALDVTIQAQILELLRARCAATGLALLLITHDLGVVAEMASRVLVMYAGEIVEAAAVEALFARPTHPYTQGLLAAVPRLDRVTTRLQTVPGTVPPATDWPPGCRFQDRCSSAFDRCRTEAPTLRTISIGHAVRCHLVDAPHRQRDAGIEGAA